MVTHLPDPFENGYVVLFIVMSKSITLEYKNNASKHIYIYIYIYINTKKKKKRFCRLQYKLNHLTSVSLNFSYFEFNLVVIYYCLFNDTLGSIKKYDRKNIEK